MPKLNAVEPESTDSNCFRRDLKKADCFWNRALIFFQQIRLNWTLDFKNLHLQDLRKIWGNQRQYDHCNKILSNNFLILDFGK